MLFSGNKKPKHLDKQQIVALFVIAFVGLVASIVMLWATVNGPGVSPDSVTYIDAARNLIGGEGFSAMGRPLNHYPPGYPLLLSIVSITTQGNIIQAARYLAAIMFGFNVAFFGLAVAISTRYSLPATFSMLAYCLFSRTNLTAHSMAWSEGAFLTFTLSSFVILSLHITKPRQALLLLASTLASIAIVLRFIGISLLPPIAFALMFINDQSLKQRIKETAISISIASFPLVLWLLRGILLDQSPTNRTFSVHPVGLSHVYAFVETLQDFFLPIPITKSYLPWGIFFLSIAIIFLLGLIKLIRNEESHHKVTLGKSFILICTVYFITYIAFLTVSISFFDAHTPVSPRILLPALLPMIAAGIILSWSISELLEQKVLWRTFFFLASFVIIFNALITVPTAVHMHMYGRGYTSKNWQESETISYLMRLEDSRKIYTNGPDVIYFLTNSEAKMIPRKMNAGSLEPNQLFESQLRRIADECIKGEAIIVYLSDITWRWYLPTTEELEIKTNLPIIHQFEDGVAYGTK